MRAPKGWEHPRAAFFCLALWDVIFLLRTADGLEDYQMEGTR